MPESRDRLLRPVDIAAIFARRRSGILGVYQDQPELEAALFGSPRQVTALRTGSVGRGRGSLGTPRAQNLRGRNLSRTPVVARGRENVPIGSARRGNSNGRGRASNSVLPSWYPRTPLRDITAVVRAIERRRECLGGSEGREIGSPMPQDLRIADSSEPPQGAYPEHIDTTMSPVPTIGVKRCPPTIGKLPKILLDITNQPSEDAEALTPQKKLLNSIDKVEKEVMEELCKLERTPSAKRAEREKRIRTLRSMR